MTSPLFPGGVAVSDLSVYDWEAADGRCGGSPHLHTASSEGYVVVEGSGAVHTLSADGAAEHALSAGDIVRFSPGAVAAEGPRALEVLHERAARLVQPRVAGWRTTWEATVAEETERTRDQLGALAEGVPGALGAASVVRAVSTPGGPGIGMCGRLTTWQWADGHQA